MTWEQYWMQHEWQKTAISNERWEWSRFCLYTEKLIFIIQPTSSSSEWPALQKRHVLREKHSALNCVLQSKRWSLLQRTEVATTTAKCLLRPNQEAQYTLLDATIYWSFLAGGRETQDYSSQRPGDVPQNCTDLRKKPFMKWCPHVVRENLRKMELFLVKNW